MGGSFCWGCTMASNGQAPRMVSPPFRRDATLNSVSFFSDRVLLDADGFVGPALQRLIAANPIEGAWLRDFLRACPDVHLTVPSYQPHLQAYLDWANANDLAPAQIHRRADTAIQDRVLWLSAVADRELASCLITANLQTAVRAASLWDRCPVYWIHFRSATIHRLTSETVGPKLPNRIKPNWL